MSRLFEVVVEVDAAGQAPAYYAQASVFAVAAGASADDAVQAVRTDLAARGVEILNFPPKAREILHADWDAYVASHWAGVRPLLPSAERIASEGGATRFVHWSFYPHD